MATQDAYIAVVANIEDGELTGFYIDVEAVVGSLDGNVYDEDAEEWVTNYSPAQAEGIKRLSSAIEALNAALAKEQA